mgnify:FL=1
MAKKKIIGTKEAAELTGRSERMIRVDIEKGLLEAEKVGNAWKIEKASIKGYMKALRGAKREREKARKVAKKS